MGKPTKYNVVNGTLNKNFKPIKRRKFGVGVQSVGPAPKPPKPNVGKTVTGALGGAASGAAAGAAGGPIGMAAGAVIGGALSLFGSAAEKKANEAQFQEEKLAYRENVDDSLQEKVFDPSEMLTQLNQAKKGLYASGTESIEVEKDELIFAKSPTGKYVLKADYQGGKTHNKGGEDYEAADGDIIFPGKDRKKVMAAYKSQDYPKLEAMRVSLPKDTQKAQDGLDNTDPKKRHQELGFKALTGLTPEEEAEYSLLNKQFGGTADNTDQFNKQIDSDLEGQRLNQMDNPSRILPGGGGMFRGQFSGNPQDANFKKVTAAEQSAFPAESTTAPAPSQVGDKTGGGLPPAVEAQGITDFAQLGQYSNPTIIPSGGTSPANVGGGDDKGGKGLQVAGQIAGYASQAFASASKLFPGEAEVQNSPQVNLANIQYEDTSRGLRRKSDEIERVQASNARNASGGNIQNYLANRRQSGVSNLKRQENINENEFSRQQVVAGKNVDINNRESLYNNQLQQRDLEVNAANRGARRNSVNQGISELGQLGGVIGADLTAGRQQEDTLKLLESMGLYDRLGNFKGK